MNEWYDSKPGRTGCGAGWDKIIFPLIDKAKEEGIGIFQIKEKFGGLRFYTDGGESKELQALIDAAEYASFETCEVCGASGRPRYGGWVKTLCDEHAPTPPEQRSATT